MSFPEILLLAFGLSMDAFAVSICKGLSMDQVTLKKAGIVGLWFGGFQALMPLLGYLLGSTFAGYIKKYDHWVAFVLLVLIGAGMLREAFSKEEDHGSGSSLAFGAMFVLAVATSIDALAVGVTLAFLAVKLALAVATIGFTTFLLSALGVKLGNVFGLRYRAKAEILGGVILILIGLKILLEHLGVF